MRTFLWTMILTALCWSGAASAAAPGAPGPDADRVELKKDKQDAEEAEEEISEAEREAERKRKDRAARVVVLKWPDTSTDYLDSTLQRNVRSRIARPGALFFPSVDLYQNGRKHPDRTLRHGDQPAWSSDTDLLTIQNEVERVSQIPYDALQPNEWSQEANKLRDMVELLWYVEKVEQREPLFLLYAYIGYAAENQNNESPPFFEFIAGRQVNYYYYLAATLAWQDKSLMSKINDQAIHGTITYYLTQLEQGGFPTFPLDLELENEFELEDFEKEYTLLLNGLEVAVDEEARVQIPLGRTDIYLQRNDTGHGLSERLEVDKFEDKAYFVRDVARKRMGIEFIDQLMLHPNECSPELDGDILNFLSIYAKLHGQAEIYIAVPYAGNPNKVFIWRYDRTADILQLVSGSTDEFPVRFAFTINAGVHYSSAAVSYNTTLDSGDAQSLADGSFDVASKGGVDLGAGAIPLNFDLRVHYNRLMVNFGLQTEYSLAGGWTESYYLPQHEGSVSDPIAVNPNDTTIGALHALTWNRNLYGGVGVVLGQNASLGLGPRFALRLGNNNAPRGFQTTGHFGWSIENPLLRLDKQRVRPLLDFDFHGGVVVPAERSIFEGVQPVVGLTAGIGTTF